MSLTKAKPPSPPPSKNCFLVTKIDLLTNQEIIDYYDCNCSTASGAQKLECSYNFWSITPSPMLISTPTAAETTPPSCANSSAYACFNNGTCVDTATIGYHCLCTGPYAGKRCEKYNPCLNKPCSASSRCNSFLLANGEDIGYACVCNDGYMGPSCRIRVADTCLASPCQNGAACLNLTSVNDPEKLSFKCVCAAGYEGTKCEKRIDFCQVCNIFSINLKEICLTKIIPQIQKRFIHAQTYR